MVAERGWPGSLAGVGMVVVLQAGVDAFVRRGDVFARERGGGGGRGGVAFETRLHAAHALVDGAEVEFHFEVVEFEAAEGVVEV